MGVLQKLQNQPEHIRKVILWTVVIVICLGLLVWWVISSSQKIKEFKKEEFIEQLNFPVLEEELPELPKN